MRPGKAGVEGAWLKLPPRGSRGFRGGEPYGSYGWRPGGSKTLTESPIRPRAAM